jgi:hypothetical protein
MQAATRHCQEHVMTKRWLTPARRSIAAFITRSNVEVGRGSAAPCQVVTPESTVGNSVAGPMGELVRSITLGRILEPRNRQELPSLAMAAKMNIMHREEEVDQ